MEYIYKMSKEMYALVRMEAEEEKNVRAGICYGNIRTYWKMHQD